MADRKPSPQQLWQTALLFGVAIFLSAKLGTLLSVPQSSYVSFWLPAGLYVGVLLLNESHTWPWLVFAGMTANILFDLLSGTPFATALGFCAAGTLEALAGAWLVRRFVAQKPKLSTLNEFLGMVGAAAILSPTLGAAIGAATLTFSGMSHSFWASWIAWWINNAMAVLLVAPFILVWFASPVSKKPLFEARGKLLEAAVLTTGLVGCTWYMLVVDKGIDSPYKSRLLPLLLWAGLRFGVRGATAANLMFALLMGFFTTHYLKGLTPAEISSGAYVGQMQSFLMVSVIIVLIPTIVIFERDQKMLAHQESEERFRTLSDNLPDSMVYQVMRHSDGTMQFLHLSAGLERLHGLSAAAVRCDFSAFFNQFVEEDRTLILHARDASAESLCVFNVNVRMRRADGSLRWMNLCSAPRRLVDGQIIWDGIETDITERIRTEAELTKLHRQQERILTAVGEGLHGIDRDGKIIFENPAAAAMLGWAVDELIGQPAHQVMHHTNADGSPYPVEECHIYGTLRDGVVCRVEDEVFWRKDGTAVPVTYTATPIRDEAGAIVGAVVAFRDITERKHAEAALAALAIRHQTLLQTAREGIHVFDEQGRMVEANAAFGTMLGYTSEEVSRLSVMDWDTTWSRAELLEKIRVLMDHPAQFEARHRRKDGSLIDVEISAVSVKLEGRRYLYNSSRDITERKRAESLANGQKQVLEMIASDAPTKDVLEALLRVIESYSEEMFCSILLLDRDGLHLRHGAAPRLPEAYCKAIDGVAIGPMVGSCGTAAYRRESVLVADIATDPLWENYKAVALPHGLRACWSTPLFDAQHTVLGTFAIYYRQAGLPSEQQRRVIELATHTATIAISRQRAKTALQESESRFRQSQKMEGIGQLAGGVAHDFNNILSALLMQTDLLAMMNQLPEEARAGLQEIRSDVNRAAELTRQLLLFSRRQVMQVRLLDLNELVLNLGKMLRRIIGEDVQLQLSLTSGALATRADAGMLEQVLMNLCVNARDAMPGGGRLLIKTMVAQVHEVAARSNPEATSGRYVCLSVSDTGVGIPPDILPKIFEPFFTTKEAGKGTGLGLATVYGIVKQHQGWIKVDNRPGQGVTFQIFLPASTENASDSRTPGEKPQPRGGVETILLVEDEESVRKPTRKLLERYGYQVVEAANGIEALKCWEDHGGTVAILLTDLVMPKGVSGQELARQLLAKQPQLKVIYTSGYSAEIAGRDFQMQLGQAFLQKPCPPDHLIETIRRILDD